MFSDIPGVAYKKKKKKKMLKSSHSRRWLPVLLAANLFSVTIDGSQSRHGHRRGGVPEDHSGTHVGAKKQTITIAGIFPITGVEGWQGGQVRKTFTN